MNGSDANGNYGGTFDVENRMAYTYYPSTGGGAYFGYDTQNRRVWQWDGAESTPGGNPSPFTVYFYGIDGKRLGAYTIASNYEGTQQNITGFFLAVSAVKQEQYFGSRRLAPMDRVGSARGAGTDSGGYYPFGEDKGTAVANDSWKFGGYWRDLVSGLDYAVNRYYSSTYGRFMSADPYRATATSPSDPSNPQSWNRFVYVTDDPVNFGDLTGLEEYLFDDGPDAGPDNNYGGTPVNYTSANITGYGPDGSPIIGNPNTSTVMVVVATSSSPTLTNTVSLVSSSNINTFPVSNNTGSTLMVTVPPLSSGPTIQAPRKPTKPTWAACVANPGAALEIVNALNGTSVPTDGTDGSGVGLISDGIFKRGPRSYGSQPGVSQLDFLTFIADYGARLAQCLSLARKWCESEL